MTAKELVKTLMGEKGISNAQMATALNITQAALWDRLNPKKTNNMTVLKLNSMLNQMDCELIIRDKNSGQEYAVDE